MPIPATPKLSDNRCTCECVKRRTPTGPPATSDSRLPTLVTALVFLALAASAAALVCDTFPNGLSEAAHSAVSPAPLFLIGAAFLTLQVGLRPRLGLLAKRIVVAAAFLLWGVAQVLPPGALATMLGDAVIAMFVVDLAIVIRQETHGDYDEAL